MPTLKTTSPAVFFERVEPEALGFDGEKLKGAEQWLSSRCTNGYRLLVLCQGKVILESYAGLDRESLPEIASAAKSVYSNLLGIIIAEGKLESADARVVDYYPEMMDVPEGRGPKPGRHAFEKDRAVTFRQLVANCSGYMKPGEEPGVIFHYQTYGMNILTHALAKIYGYYDTSDPRGFPGFKKLVKEKLADPIGAKWQYTLGWTPPPEDAGRRYGVFGYYCSIGSTPEDLARLGWLWCNWGRWEDKQVIPEAWMRESVKAVPGLRSASPADEAKYGALNYGLGIWTNEQGKLWPHLPRDGFSACGAGGHYLSVFPDQQLVIVQNPGYYAGPPDRANAELLEMILTAHK